MKGNGFGKKIIQWLVILLGVAAGFSVGFFGAMYMEAIEASAIEWAIAVASVIVALYLQIILHEAGHLLFGLLTGYKFVSFRIDSFILYKKQGKFHFGRYSLAGTGGQCLMAPPDLADGMMPYRLYNMGGVILNLVTAGIFAILFFGGNAERVFGLFCIAMILVGIFFAIINGIPMHMNGVDNDGYNAISMGKNKESLRALWLQLKINERLTEGERLRDMPREWFEKPSQEGMQNSMVASLEAIRCNRLLDSMLFEETSQAIDAVMKNQNAMVGVHKMLLQIDQVFCEILGERRAEVLDQLEEKEMKAFLKTMKTFPTVLRTQYAYAFCIEKDSVKAAKLKEQFVKIMKTYPNQGEVESEYELIAHCEQIQDKE